MAKQDDVHNELGDVAEDIESGDEQGIDDEAQAELDAAAMAAVDTTEIKPSSAVGKFRRNTGAGLVLNGVAMGLAEIYDPVVKEDPPIVQEESTDPPDRDIDTFLDSEDPTQSTVTFKRGFGRGRHEV